MTEVAKEAAQFIGLGNQCGEGWFLTGDMIDLIEKGAKQIVCLQPFGCLPNHVTGKGMVKTLSAALPRRAHCCHRLRSRLQCSKPSKSTKTITIDNV